VAQDRAIFYFDTNSPYAYLAAHRIDDLIPGAVWRPIALAMLFREIQKIPWSLKPGRETDMAEIERRAAALGLPPITWPEDWPAGTWSFNPIRAAVVAEEHDLVRPFALECYRLLFAENRSLAELDNTLAAARAVGLDPDEVRERIGAQDVKDRLRAYTDEAVGLGAVGVPTVAVGGELFWGDDRLEEAAEAARAAA
jgi:2-hydroxychromene-2-carboxylate isomerase